MSQTVFLLPLEKQTTSYRQYDYKFYTQGFDRNIQKTLCIFGEVKFCYMGHVFIAALLLIHVIMTWPNPLDILTPESGHM